MSFIEGFDMIKVVYIKKRKDVERRGDEVIIVLVGIYFLCEVLFFLVYEDNVLCIYV